MQSLNSSHSISNMRDVSVSTAMSMLRIDDERQVVQQKEHQAISRSVKPPSTPKIRHKTSISTGLRNLRINSAENALVLFQAPGDSLVAHKTPSQIPVLSKSEAVMANLATPSRTPRFSPQNASFLTKDSNITGFIAWDVEGRVENMEAMYEQLKDKFNGTDKERNTFEEAINLYKARSKFLCQVE